MVKALLAGEMSSSAILGSFAVELGTGQVEILAAEAVILGLILAGRAIKHKVQENKRERLLEEQNRQQIEEFEREEQENQQRWDQEREEASQSNMQQYEQGIEQERENRISQLEGQMNIDRESSRIHTQTQNPDFYLYGVGVREEIDREERRLEEEAKQQGRYDPNVNYYQRRYGNPDGGGGNGGGGNGGGGNGGNGGGGYPYNNNNGGNNVNNNNGRNKNPYDDMINFLQNQYNQQQKRQKEEREQAEKIQQSDQQKVQTELTKEQIDNQNLIQQQLEAQLIAMGQDELTQEQIYVQLESIERMIDDQIPDQVKVRQIYSNTVSNF